MTEIVYVPQSLWDEEQLSWHTSWGKDRKGAEDRGINEIEQVLGYKFSFENHLRELFPRFPNAEFLEILEGGCGYGNTLGDIKRLQQESGRQIRTTGVTLQEDHIPYAQQNGVDYLIIGPVEAHIFNSRYHFILDVFGASYYFFEKAVPAYSRLLVPRGTGLISLNGEERFLQQNELRTIEVFSHYSSSEVPTLFALVEKV